ncbi:MAG: hypothetical protein R6X32_16110 [Chloroflexota bacterium]
MGLIGCEGIVAVPIYETAVLLKNTAVLANTILNLGTEVCAWGQHQLHLCWTYGRA